MPLIFLGAKKALHMGKIKHSQEQDQVETKEHPAAKAAGSVLPLDDSAAKPATKEIGLRSQGDVGKQRSKPVAKTEPAIAEAESAVEHEGPGHLRSQGAVALKKKAEPAEFSNRHMRSELATKAETSKPERAKAASAAPKGEPKEVSKAKTAAEEKPDHSMDSAGKEHAVATPKSGANPGKVAPTIAPTEDEAKTVKAPQALAPKADLKVGKADPLIAPKSEATLETAAPTISLKVAVKLDTATLVMNPKSEVKLDDAQASAAPKAEVKAEKVAPSTQPKVEIKKDKATPVKDPKSAVDAAKTAPASTPKVEVKLDKRETAKAPKTEAKVEKAAPVPMAPPAPEPSGETEADDEKATPIEAEEDAVDGMDLQDTTERAHQTGSLSERRHRRTRELRTHKEPAAGKPA